MDRALHPMRMREMNIAQRFALGIWRCRLKLALMAACVLSTAAYAEEVRCPYRLSDQPPVGLTTKADTAIAGWRNALKTKTGEPAIRQAMADYAINLLLLANRLEAAGKDSAATDLRRYVLRQLPDTDWRIQHQAGQGDLGAIEARQAWLRTAKTPDTTALCALAARGAALGGSESSYRLALCTTEAGAALTAMKTAAAKGHPAAMEIVGRLCISGKLGPNCATTGLCRAAQAGRIGAAAAIGWKLTEGDQPDASSEGAAWLQRAAEAGEALAQNNLGEWHERHNSTAGGRLMALTWYQRSARQGLPAAMVNAARLLASDGPKGCREAQELLVKAESSGLTQAGEWRKSLVCGQ
jgi:hypothetical protein